jgi:hypothetical protein
VITEAWDAIGVLFWGAVMWLAILAAICAGTGLVLIAAVINAVRWHRAGRRLENQFATDSDEQNGETA